MYSLENVCLLYNVIGQKISILIVGCEYSGCEISPVLLYSDNLPILYTFNRTFFI